MIFILSITFAFIHADTFFISSRPTNYYQMNVQINGNDISNLLSTANKVSIDSYLIDGPNLLSVCYAYNSEAGVPNVKQLAKIELFNNKVKTKLRGLASHSSKELLPEFISVSPQPKSFVAQPEVCISHNFQDYTAEQLQAMHDHNISKPMPLDTEVVDYVTPEENPLDTVSTSFPEEVSGNQQLSSNEPFQSFENALVPLGEQGPDVFKEGAIVYPENASGDVMASKNLESLESSESLTASDHVVDAENTQAANEALSFIPFEDMPIDQTQTKFMLEDSSKVVSSPEDFESGNEKPLDGNLMDEQPKVDTAKVDGQQEKLSYTNEENRIPATQESSLSDSDFFSELDIVEDDK